MNLLSSLKYILGSGYNLSNDQIFNMDFQTLDKYTDATFSRSFEGLDFYMNLSSEEMAMVNEENKWMQLDIYSDDARKTLVQEILQIPIGII